MVLRCSRPSPKRPSALFRSRRRPLIVPQAEHARFAGTLALNWAEPVALPFASFVRGVADHDRGYGELDNDPLGEVDEERWLGIQRRGYEPRGEDPVVDLVVALHVRRLLGSGEADDVVAELLAATGASREDAEAADAVTNVCDVISLELCFEAPNERDVRGYRIAVDGLGGVEVDPWPFAAPRLTGVVAGYEAEGYPDRLVAAPVTYDVSPAH